MTVNHNIDRLYIELHDNLKLVRSFSEIKNIDTLIKVCRLKPIEYLYKKTNKLIMYKQWVDEFGNSLIIKNKKMEIIFNDLSLNRDQIVNNTDLYYGLPLNKIISISKMLFMHFGKDEDLHQDYCLISLLGIDNYLRTYLYMYNEWGQVSPLLLGIDNLKILVENIDITYFMKLAKDNNLIPCVSGQTWLTCMPVGSEFMELITKECEYLIPIFKENN